MTITKENINYFQNFFFELLTVISYLLLIVSVLGISQKALEYLDTISFYIRIYICLFLIWRFNPIRTKYEFTELDRKIAFSAGLFVLSTTALNKYLVYIKDEAKIITNKVKNDITQIL